MPMRGTADYERVLVMCGAGWPGRMERAGEPVALAMAGRLFVDHGAAGWPGLLRGRCLLPAGVVTSECAGPSTGSATAVDALVGVGVRHDIRREW